MSRIRLNPDGVDVVAAQDPPHGWAQVTEADTFKRYTLVFVIDREERKILLGLKKRGFATGKINGFGGKLEPGETIVEAAARELHEECGLTVAHADLHPAGELTAIRSDEKLVIHIFLTYTWSGVVTESEEMAPEWVSLDAIPYPRMHPEQTIYLPLILGPRSVAERFVARLDARPEYRGWWMGWVPRVDDDTA